MTPTARIYSAAGQPPMALYGAPAVAAITGQCRLCGTHADGYPWAAWVKDTFTDHDVLGPGETICLACVFCADDHSLVLQQRTGRDKPQRMRNYSHVVTREGAWLPLGKDQKRAMAAALLDDPIVASISLAGQKHVLFRARVGQWQIEEARCWPDAGRLARLLEIVSALYAAPAITKAMIETGEYSSRALLTVGPTHVYAADAPLRPFRGSPLFSLAVWLAQREDTENDDAARRRRGAPDADLARDSSRLQAEIQLHDLGPAPEPDTQRGLYEHAPEVSQPDLFAAEREPW